MVDEGQIREIILKRAVDGKLTCEEAHRISEEMEAPLALIGLLCNREEPKIRISKCLLGCF